MSEADAEGTHRPNTPIENITMLISGIRGLIIDLADANKVINFLENVMIVQDRQFSEAIANRVISEIDAISGLRLNLHGLEDKIRDIIEDELNKSREKLRIEGEDHVSK